MKKAEMSLMEVFNELGKSLKAVKNHDLSPEERQAELEEGKVVIGIAKQMVQAVAVTKDVEKLNAQVRKINPSKLDYLIGEVPNEQD